MAATQSDTVAADGDITPQPSSAFGTETSSVNSASETESSNTELNGPNAERNQAGEKANGHRDAVDGKESKRSLAQSMTKREEKRSSNPRIRPTEDIFDPEDPMIKEDIIRMILQYLSDEGYHASRAVVQDEANLKWHEREERTLEAKRLKKAILDGDWAEVDKLTSKPIVKNHKSFLYAVYKQQYLEYIEQRDIQKAFTFLNKRIKPLENLSTTPNEFKDLCYLLTAKTVHDAPSFKNWEGVGPAREKLVEHLQTTLDFENSGKTGSIYVAPNRLLNMLRQAVAYQIEFSQYHPTIAPVVNTLLQDYSSFVIPNACANIMRGHKGNVKCAEFIGADGLEIVSGSSDNTLRIWQTTTGKCMRTLRGHTSRIWDVSSSKSGSMVASASGDGTVKLWDMKSVKKECILTLSDGQGDVYSTAFHPAEDHVASGGYDKIVRLFDLSTGEVVKSFSGHQLAVSKVIFNPLGNLIISGSKDNTIKFWDIVSGTCIRTITSHLGEVTSVAMNSTGTLLLSSSKDNSNRLWDLRTVRPIQKLKGHLNTSKNFIRSAFANNSMVVGGSEDGTIYIWDQETGSVLQKLRGHTGGAVYSAVWNESMSTIVSCGDDCLVRTWSYDENQPLDV